MDDVVVITLFRHGLTEGNKRKVYLGWNDSPLCEETIHELSAIHLNDGKYDSFFASDLNRCIHTMKLLFPTVKPMFMQELREMNFGQFEGKTYDDLKNDPSYKRWLDNFSTFSPPGGESFQQFANRIEEGWNKLVQIVLEKNVRHPFVVTHGGVIRYLLSQYAPFERPFWDWNIENGKGFQLIFTLEQLKERGRCISLQEVPLTEKENG